ncbi:MAG: efflux RND transporter periplasmic adaptor subunit [Desulfobacterales bacterium]|nr:efflux RND transporter periplasmic adaptor subunit [Desulfobacterales bacterium]
MKNQGTGNGFIYKAGRILLILLLAIAITVLLIKFHPKAERREPVETGALVEVLPVVSKNANMLIEAFGTVTPRKVLKLVAEVRGPVAATHPSFREGSFVKKGDVLIRIDQRTYALEVKSRGIQVRLAQADLKQLQQRIANLSDNIKLATADVDLARTEYLRLKKLAASNVAARTTLDKTEQGYIASRMHLQDLNNQMALTGSEREKLVAHLDAAKAALEQAALDLERTLVTAPFDGWVLEKLIEDGQHVNAGEYLGRIYQAGALDIEIEIPAKDLRWLPSDFSPGALPEAEVSFGSIDMLRAWKGRLSRPKAQMNEQTRMLPFIVEVNAGKAAGEGPDPLSLRPGMFVRVRIQGRIVARIVLLPRHVVHEDDTVYVMENNLLRIRPVRVLRQFKEFVYIDQGLADGEQVIKTPLSRASNGMRVRTGKTSP